jgi:GTP-binding protein HflX
LFERHAAGEKAILIHIHFPDVEQAALEEFKVLVKSADATIIDIVTGVRTTVDKKYFIGTGKVEQVKATLSQTNADVVIINHDLSPTQERNLEKALSCRVLSRSGLILDIFARRARTFEGKLQVELAQLQHLSTRLVRGWTHLERQKGELA